MANREVRREAGRAVYRTSLELASTNRMFITCFAPLGRFWRKQGRVSEKAYEETPCDGFLAFLNSVLGRGVERGVATSDLNAGYSLQL